MSPLLLEAVAGIIRASLSFAAGWMVEHHVWGAEDANRYLNAASVGIAMYVLSAGWGVWQKYKSRVKLVTALASPMPQSEDQLQQTIAKGVSASAGSVKNETPIIRFDPTRFVGPSASLLLLLCVTPVHALQMNLPSDFAKTTGEEEQIIEAEVVVTSSAQGYFILANMVVFNGSASDAAITLRLHEASTAVPDVTQNFTTRAGTTYTYQVHTQAAGLTPGPYTWEVIASQNTSGPIVYQDSSYLGIFGDTVPSGAIVSLNGASVAMQSFDTSTACEGFVIGTDTVTGVHTFCLPINVSGLNSIAFGDAATASGASSTAFGENSNANGNASVAIGKEADASNAQSTSVGFLALSFGASSTCVGYNCSAEDGAIAIGAGAQTADANTAQIGGFDAPVAELRIGPGDEQDTATYPASVTVRPNFEGGTNVPGIPLVLQGSPGTGTQSDGGVLINVCPGGSSGTDANPCTPAWSVLAANGNLIPVGDKNIGNIFLPLTELHTDDLFVYKRTSEVALAPQTVNASTAILANATKVYLNAAGSFTFTVAPTIANGFPGQRVTIVNIDSTDVITLPDRSSLGSSNLRLRNGDNFALSAGGGNATLEYNSQVGDWLQMAGESVATATRTATPTATRTNTATVTPTP